MARQKRSKEPNGCLTFFLGWLAVVLVVGAVIWFVSAAGHVLGLTPTYNQINHHGHTWIDARYQNVPWGYVLTVLTLVVGVPLSIALSAELARPRPRAGVAAAPVGAR